MIVLKRENKIYYPKLTIRSCLAINTLFGDVTQPLLTATSVESQILLLFLSLEQYHLNDDELCDIADSIEDLNSLILEIYQESGIINQIQPQLTTERENEPVNDSSNDNVTFESHVMDLLAHCMSIGMKEDEFYNLTLNQVTRHVEAYSKRQENQLQEKAYFDYQLANLIGVSVSRLLDKDAKYPSFEKIYPFAKGSHEKEVDKEWEMEVQRNKLREWAEQMNQKITKKESC